MVIDYPCFGIEETPGRQSLRAAAESAAAPSRRSRGLSKGGSYDSTIGITRALSAAPKPYRSKSSTIPA
jgi:hypothetical protein